MIDSEGNPSIKLDLQIYEDVIIVWGVILVLLTILAIIGCCISRMSATKVREAQAEARVASYYSSVATCTRGANLENRDGSY